MGGHILLTDSQMTSAVVAPGVCRKPMTSAQREVSDVLHMRKTGCSGGPIVGL